MLNSVKAKITATAFVIISIIMLLTTYRDVNGTEQKLLNGQKEKAVLISEKIAHDVTILMLKNKWQDLQSFIEKLVLETKELGGIKIFLPENGTIVASSDPLDIGKRTYDKNMDMIRDQFFQNAFLSEKNGQGFASKLTAIHNNQACYKCHGTEKQTLGILEIDISLADVHTTVQEIKKEHYIYSLMAFLVMVVGISFVVSSLIDKPAKRMINTIKKIEAGDLSLRMDANKNDEFGLMAKSFNSMLESLEHAKKEVELYHFEQMQRAARLASLGEIISGIAHEIKNPLTGISCAVQIIQAEMNDNDRNKEITAEILGQIKRLDRIVKDLLNYARPKPLNFHPYNIADVMTKTLVFAQPEASRYNIIIEKNIEDNIPDILMDPDQMQQVFLNLMINAIQAMPKGGNLILSISKSVTHKTDDLPKIQIESDEVLLVSFEDTGDGIEQKYLESIFDPFFTRKTTGTGLGLSISQRIIQEHGGEIIVRSTVGKGSTFIILLPVIKNNNIIMATEAATS